MTRITSRQHARRCGLEEHTIEFDTFQYEVNVVVGPITKLSEYLRWKLRGLVFEDFEVPTSFGALSFSYRNYAPIIWLPRKPRTSIEIARLAHEWVHVTLAFCKSRLFVLTETEEIFAYFLQHGVHQTMTKLGVK